MEIFESGKEQREGSIVIWHYNRIAEIETDSNNETYKEKKWER
jgi:hypothetical protein